MPFQIASAEHRTMHRLAERLQEAAIPHAVMGAMAVNLHGANSFTNSVDFLLTQQGLDLFRKDFVGSTYDQVPKRPRRFVDRESSVTVNVRITGHYPGRTNPGPFTLPDPTMAGEEIGQVHVMTLPLLIQCNLGGRRYYDLADVVSLIRVHQLGEAFLEKLHPSVHRDFIKCLEEKRREEEFEASGSSGFE